MKRLLLTLLLMLFVGAPVALAGDDDPTEPTEYKMLADDEGGTDAPTE